MSEKSFLKEFSDDISGVYLGEIVDNEDPLKKGRCKIYVYGVFDGSWDLNSDKKDIPIDDLPWAYPNTINVFGGNNGGGNISIPKKGTKVKVIFNRNDIYSPEYICIQELNKSLLKEIEDSYENAHVLLYDEDENTKILYTQKNGIDIFSKNANINIDKDSNIFIKNKNDLKIKLNDDTIIIENSNSKIEINGSDITINTTNNINIKSSKILLSSANIEIGQGLLSPAINSSMLSNILTALASSIDTSIASLGGVSTLSDTLPSIIKSNASNSIKISF